MRRFTAKSSRRKPAAEPDYVRLDIPRDAPHRGRRNEMHLSVTEADRKDPTHCGGEIFG
ncbi:hypothetical protein [Azospirillum endophyticum]